MTPMMTVPMWVVFGLDVFRTLDFAAPVRVGDGPEEEADGGYDVDEIEHG